MKVIYFGTPHFAANILEVLLQNGINIVAVITKPDRPQGRSGKPVATPVKQVVLTKAPHLPLFQPERVSDLEFSPTLESFNADLFVVVAYGEIIKQHLLDMPALGCINVHASILPKYRGAAPIQWSLINGEEESGITIMQMVKKMDAGDIIKIAKVKIEEDTTFPELEKHLCQAAGPALLEVLAEYQKGMIPEHYSQDHSLVSFSPKIELENCYIDWKSTSQTIHNLVRGVTPDPGAWCYIQLKKEKKRLKIIQTKRVTASNFGLSTELKSTPGSILKYHKEEFIVACGDGALQISQLQLEGKRRMSAEEFIRGIPKEHLNFENHH